MLNQVKTIRVHRAETKAAFSAVPQTLHVVASSWIARLLWRLLHKCRIVFDYPATNEWFRTADFDGGKLVEQIGLSQADIMRIWNNEARTLLVGHDVLNGLLREMSDRLGFMQFNVEARFGFEQQLRVLGVGVVVVPWMTGWVLIPDLERNERAEARRLMRPGHRRAA